MQATTTARPSPAVTALAASAVADLQPVVIVNRRVDTALGQLDGAPSDPFPTIHTDGRSGLDLAARRTWRAVNEQVRGTHGEGADAGHTVYGSVRFVPTEDAQRGAQGVIDALTAQGDVGIRAYGPVSFVLDPEVMQQRATFAADDTGVTLAHVRAPDDVAAVVAERLERGTPDPDAPRVEDLLAMPSSSARDAIRGWLLSDGLANSDGYIEAQVRRVAPEDLLATFVETRDPADVELRAQVDPGATPQPADVERIREELEPIGVPTFSPEPAS